MHPLSSLGRKFAPYLWAPIVWSPLVGLVRTLTAVGTLITLCFTSTDALFRPVAGQGEYPQCASVNSLGIFCLGNDQLSLMKFICILALLLVISGFLPQVTGVLHFWVAFSVNNAIAIPDGGDQIASNIALLLIPLTLTDPRVSHWQRTRVPRWGAEFRMGIGTATLVALKAQIVVLYFYSATGKMYQQEWAEGSVMYYVFNGPFGPSGLMAVIGTWIVSIPVLAFFVAWGVLLLEIMLSIAPATPRRWRLYIFVLGVSLHVGMALFMGLWSFEIVMIGAALLVTLPLKSRPYTEGWSLFEQPWPHIWFGLPSESIRQNNELAQH